MLPLGCNMATYVADSMLKVNRNYNYVCQRYDPSMNESSVFKMWYNNIHDVERADAIVLDDLRKNIIFN